MRGGWGGVKHGIAGPAKGSPALGRGAIQWAADRLGKSRMEKISLAAARRVAITAQGLARRGASAAPGPRQLDAVLNRIGLLQMELGLRAGARALSAAFLAAWRL